MHILSILFSSRDSKTVRFPLRKTSRNTIKCLQEGDVINVILMFAINSQPHTWRATSTGFDMTGALHDGTDIGEDSSGG